MTADRPDVSVVVPAYQAEATLDDCLRGLAAQNLSPARYDVVVVDDGSSDGTAAVAARHRGVVVVRRPNGGAAAARNTGWHAARGRWIAFIDADCVPTRGWLSNLLGAVEPAGDAALGAAGKTVGLGSATGAARFADLIGSLDAERYLRHPRWPFAPSCNLLYRRDALASAGGFDERFRTYEACDLHTRLLRGNPGAFTYVSRAVVFHRHRASWGGYWRQQRGYGAGYAQFALRHNGEIAWSWAAELRAWCDVLRLGLAAAFPARDDDALLRRGSFVKAFAQRIGFDSVYWRVRERERWAR